MKKVGNVKTEMNLMSNHFGKLGLMNWWIWIETEKWKEEEVMDRREIWYGGKQG